MAQAFLTTYDKAYRWPEIEKRRLSKRKDKFSEAIPEGDIWIVGKTLEEKHGEDGEKSLEEAKAKVKKMYRKFLWSTYQVEYCRGLVPKDSDASVQNQKSFENELFEYCDKLYGNKSQKIPPPLPTSRRLYGYMRPRRMYCPTTDYQQSYGKLGYQILKGQFAAKSTETTNTKSETDQTMAVMELSSSDSTTPLKKEEMEDQKSMCCYYTCCR